MRFSCTVLPMRGFYILYQFQYGLSYGKSLLCTVWGEFVAFEEGILPISRRNELEVFQNFPEVWGYADINYIHVPFCTGVELEIKRVMSFIDIFDSVVTQVYFYIASFCLYVSKRIFVFIILLLFYV